MTIQEKVVKNQTTTQHILNDIEEHKLDFKEFKSDTKQSFEKLFEQIKEIASKIENRVDGHDYRLSIIEPQVKKNKKDISGIKEDVAKNTALREEIEFIVKHSKWFIGGLGTIVIGNLVGGLYIIYSFFLS